MDAADGDASARSPRDGAERLFVVRVSDNCYEPLAGRDGGSYQSPPQPLADARALVALLIGRNHHEQIEEGEIAVPIAGGRRTISLEAA
jgi:hypothetical protein